jgi:hypothetical protein
VGASIVSARAIELMPALLTSTSTRFQRARIASTVVSTIDSSEMSPAKSAASQPATLLSVAVHACKSSKASEYPAAAKVSAVRRPIPCAAPVMTASFIKQHSDSQPFGR